MFDVYRRFFSGLHLAAGRHHSSSDSLMSGRGDGVQGVLTLFCSGAAQLCHDLRVVELKEQLEVEEEDGDRQEEEVEEKGRSRIKESAPWMRMKMIVNALRT